MAQFSKPVGRLQYFRSTVDGNFHPYAVCAADMGRQPKPLILQVDPGAINDLPGAVAHTEKIAGIAAKHGKSCVVLRPTGRGPGTLYQNYGEVDVFEAIEAVCAEHAIDRDRISITGSSMGGAAVWYLISHYPDFFSAGVPFCGYCDHRLFEKPGGLACPILEWEEPSWKSRSAAFLVENFGHTPVWIAHGAWDRAVGGGVPVEHSRQMARLLKQAGCPHRYTEIPATGHDSNHPRLWDKLIPWMLQQRRKSAPDHVRFVTYGLRHNRSHWVTVDQLERHGERARVEARRTRGGKIIVSTENIRAFSLGPIAKTAAVTVDGQKPVRAARFLKGADGIWKPRGFAALRGKKHGTSGPIGDLFFDGLVVVPGTKGNAEETFFNNWLATHTLHHYRRHNGGVHRGVFAGECHADLPIVRDTDLTGELWKGKNLLLIGTHRTNVVLAGFRKRIPLSFEGDTIRLFGKSYTAKHSAVVAVFPHPNNPGRYVAVHGGTAPDAICWGSHLGMQVLPDFFVYAKGRVLDWGFCDSGWKMQRK